VATNNFWHGISNDGLPTIMDGHINHMGCSGVVEMNKDSWIPSFRQDINSKWSAMNEEYNLYLDNNKAVYLQQACEKLFSIIENYLQIKYAYKTDSYGNLLSKVSNDDSIFLSGAMQLHRYFYNGQTELLDLQAQQLYLTYRDKMKSRLNKK